MQYFRLFHSQNSYRNAPHCYVIRTLPLLYITFSFPVGRERQLVHNADHSLPSTAGVKNAWSYASTLPRTCMTSQKQSSHWQNPPLEASRLKTWLSMTLGAVKLYWEVNSCSVSRQMRILLVGLHQVLLFAIHAVIRKNSRNKTYV
jgi:hypothetical protein